MNPHELKHQIQARVTAGILPCDPVRWSPTGQGPIVAILLDPSGGLACSACDEQGAEMQYGGLAFHRSCKAVWDGVCQELREASDPN